MRTSRTALISGASLACAAAILLGGSGIANAADSLPSKPSTSQSADDDGPGHGMRGPRGPLFGDLVAKGTITQAQADAIKAALDAQRTADQAAHDKAEADALASLVSKGTITQAQADAIAKADRGGVRDLVRAGTITIAQAQAVRDAMKALHDQREAAGPGAKVDAVLAALVSKGTITQAQADAIKANAPKGPRMKGGKQGMRGMGDGRGHHGRGGDRDGDQDGRGGAPAMPTPSSSTSAG